MKRSTWDRAALAVLALAGSSVAAQAKPGDIVRLSPEDCARETVAQGGRVVYRAPPPRDGSAIRQPATPAERAAIEAWYKQKQAEVDRQQAVVYQPVACGPVDRSLLNPRGAAGQAPGGYGGGGFFSPGGVARNMSPISGGMTPMPPFGGSPAPVVGPAGGPPIILAELPRTPLLLPPVSQPPVIVTTIPPTEKPPVVTPPTVTPPVVTPPIVTPPTTVSFCDMHPEICSPVTPITPVPVPEPASILLLGFGVAALGAARRGKVQLKADIVKLATNVRVRATSALKL